MMEFISIVPWTMIAQVGNVIILFLFMKKFLFRRVQDMLQKRMETTNAVFDQADAANSQAKALREQYEVLMKGAGADAQKIIQDASAAAREKSESMIALAQKDTRYMMSAAKEEIRQEKAKAADEIKNEAAGMAVGLASRILEREIKEADHHSLILEAIEDSGEAL